MVCWKYLLSLDISGIHNYIFGTNKLREIRGASVLLDKLNSTIAVAEIESGKYGTQDKDWSRIVMGGGNLKILFVDKARAEEYKAIIYGKFREIASTAKVTIIISERNGQSDKEWLESANRELQIEKGLVKEKNQLIAGSFFKACQSCGLYPAEEQDKRPGGIIRYICKSCHQKVTCSSEYKNLKIYKKLIEESDFEPKFPSEFSEIGEESSPGGYIGFVYADANRIGEYLSDIATFDELRKFSEDVEKATFDATVRAITNHFKDKFFLGQIILAGGDDLILALPAHKAVDVAIDFCEEFNNLMASYNISTSAAVVICHDTLPINNVLDAAESLLKNAKAESKKRESGSYLDFTVVTGSALEDPVSRRKRELEYQDSGVHSITRRPYSLTEMSNLIKDIRDLKSADFPTTKLRMLYDSLFKGHCHSIIEALYIKTRLNDNHKGIMQKLIVQSGIGLMFPWKEIAPNQYLTPFGDIVELYDFIH